MDSGQNAPRRDFKLFLEAMPLDDDIDLIELIGRSEIAPPTDLPAEWGEPEPG